MFHEPTKDETVSPEIIVADTENVQDVMPWALPEDWNDDDDKSFDQWFTSGGKLEVHENLSADQERLSRYNSSRFPPLNLFDSQNPIPDHEGDVVRCKLCEKNTAHESVVAGQESVSNLQPKHVYKMSFCLHPTSHQPSGLIRSSPKW